MTPSPAATRPHSTGERCYAMFTLAGDNVIVGFLQYSCCNFTDSSAFHKVPATHGQCILATAIRRHRSNRRRLAPETSCRRRRVTGATPFTFVNYPTFDYADDAASCLLTPAPAALGRILRPLRWPGRRNYTSLRTNAAFRTGKLFLDVLD